MQNLPNPYCTLPLISSSVTAGKVAFGTYNNIYGTLIADNDGLYYNGVSLFGVTGPTGYTGNTGPTGPTGVAAATGNLLHVDTVYGNDTAAALSPYVIPFKTVNAAITAMAITGPSTASGQTILIYPGVYELSSGITIPNKCSIRGVSLQTVTIQMTNVTSATTLITMGENTRVEDVTLKLTASAAHDLTGVLFAGTTTTTAKLRTAVVTVDNSAVSSSTTTNVCGVLCSGTGSSAVNPFNFNCVKGSTINVYSNGQGIKRGILINGTNIATTRDTNVYVAQPTTVTSTGSYVGVETNDSGNLGSIQLRSTTVGCVKPVAGNLYTASDILQTTPPTILDPTYLASAGIQVGPGVDLVTKSAGSKGFSTYIYPTTIFYGLKGNLTSAPSGGYLWSGTQGVSAGVFPDPGIPAAYYRIQQPTILSGLFASLNIPTGSAQSVTVLVKRTPDGGTIGDTIFTVTLSNTEVTKTFYNGSVDLNVRDKLHVYVTYTGNSGNNTAHDLSVQLDMF